MPQAETPDSMDTPLREEPLEFNYQKEISFNQMSDKLDKDGPIEMYS